MKSNFKVIIVGSGFGGMSVAINLIKKGISDFCLLERKNFLGGTWCQNKYPGAAVDVHSPLYSLYNEPYPWTEMFAKQKELETYTNYILAKYKLEKKAILDCEVTEAKWLEDKKKWEVYTTNHKTKFNCNYLINATGALSQPIIPKLAGKEKFKGKSFHSNNWDETYDYTNKKVAVIGSGSSAAQIIPAIAPKVKELSVFQRTANWVMPRSDYKFSKTQRRWLKNILVYRLLRVLVYWSLETKLLGFVYFPFLLKKIGQKKAEKHLENSINNKKIKSLLKPNFTIGCKRIILSNNFYPCFNRKNVTLYTKDKALKEINENGILTKDGKQINLDFIVYATGFDVKRKGAVPYKVVGRNNLNLFKYWYDGAKAYLGTSVPNFPNFFMITGPNTGIGHTSLIYIIESQVYYILKAIKYGELNNQTIEVKESVTLKYNQYIQKKMKNSVWQNGGCQSWYKNKNGKVFAMYPDFTFIFRLKNKNFRKNHHLI